MLSNLSQSKIVNKLYDDVSWSFTKFNSTRDNINEFIDIADNIVFLLKRNNIKYRDFSILGSFSQHSINVGILNGKIGEYLMIDNIFDLVLGGILHDIGKQYMPKSIMDKPGRLTEKERGIINTHTDIGHSVMNNIYNNDNVLNIIKNHHKIDKTFSKDVLNSNLKEEKLVFPLVCAISDITDAMLSHRVYKKPLTIVDVKKDLLNKGFDGIDKLFDYIL
ncbi:MAG: HD domain-containing protein [Bacilli bacterium]|nr:HD domain-containing protein [Bacilli bacterium]